MQLFRKNLISNSLYFFPQFARLDDDRVVTSDYFLTAARQDTLTVYPPEYRPIDPGNYQVSEFPEMGLMTDSFVLSPRVIYTEYENAGIFGGAVYEKCKRLIPECYPERPATLANFSKSGRLKRALKQIFAELHVEKRYPEAFFAFGPTGANYFHFTIDYLPRLIAFRKLAREGKVPDSNCNYLTSMPRLTPWQLRYLELIDFEERLEMLSHRRTTRINRLHVVSQTRMNMTYCPTALENMRHTIFPRLKPGSSFNFSRRVYVSRGKDSGRHVINEKELVQVLSKYGFVAYQLEHMPLDDQIHLFRDCEFVVAPHGAGLTNLLYSHQPSVLELFSERRLDIGYGAFLSLCLNVGGRYSCLVSDKSHKNGAFSVDIDKVKASLEKMGI